MDFDNTEQVNALARLPAQPSPVVSERSVWSAPWRAVKAAAAEVVGSTADVLNAYGSASAIAAQADPAARAVVGDKAIQEGADEGRRQLDSGTAFTSEAGSLFRGVSRELRPDPATASKAEQIVFGVVRPVAKLVGAGLTMGPAGVLLMSGEEGFTQSDDLREQGVDLATRTKVGALTSTVTAATAFLPMAGPTLKATAGLYLAGGPGAFMAQQLATQEILRHANYEQLAQQYDPLDPTGLALSALIPLPFAAHGAARVVRGAQARAGEAVTPTLSEPRNVEAMPHEVTPEVVDAAMTHNLTVQRDVSEAGGPVDGSPIPRAEHLPAIERAMERRLAERVDKTFDQVAEEYAQLPDSAGGKVLNTDIARELSADYLADRTKSAAVHEPASYFIKQLYERKLAVMPKGEDVLFTSGGTGAGKTTAINQVESARILSEDAGLIYDTNMNSLPSSVKKIEQALDAGMNVRIIHVQRDALEALVNGALPRAMRQAEKFGSGRTVPLVEHARTHRGAAEVIQQLAERYKDDDRVDIRVIDNTRGKGGARSADLGFVRTFDYNGLEGRLYEALKQERDSGRISGHVFEGTEGSASFGLRSVDDRGAGQQPERAHEAAPATREQPAAVGGLNKPADAGAALPALNTEPSSAQPLKAPSADAHLRSLASRVASVEKTAAGMVVRTDEQGNAVTVADELARVRRETQEGTDNELGALDADLLQVAADCALAMGPA